MRYPPEPGNRNYTHADDYDPPGANWLDHTVLGSAYQEQLDLNSPSSRWRHRNFMRQGPWMQGPAPDEA